MIAFAEVEVGTGGVTSCAECGHGVRAQTTSRATADIVAELARVAAAWSSGPGPNVTFCGLEPFVHPELPKIISAATAAGFERVRLRTDAGALTLPANARGVVSVGVTQLEVVLLGDEATHDGLTGRPGAFAAAQAGCAAFLDAARAEGATLAITGLVVACRHNAAALPAAVLALVAAGAVAVGIDASALKERDAAILESALETAVTSGVAGFVVGSPVPLARPFGDAPWSTLTGGY